MKLKPIPANTVVHTPTEAEAKELLAILHKNGYKWSYCSESLINLSHWEQYKTAMGYFIDANDDVIHYGDMDDRDNLEGYTILTLAEFREKYVEEEKPQPKFEVGDWVIHNHKNREVGQIVAHFPDEVCRYSVCFGEEYHNMAEFQLLPYTEPETKEDAKDTKDETIEKQKGEKGNNSGNSQLNLCELLADHIGEKFYSPVFGECKLRTIYDENNNGHQPLLNVILEDGDTHNIASTGHLSWNLRKHGSVIFFPSRALYKQYPLDPYAAWMKWNVEQKKWKLRIGYSREDSIPTGDIIDLFFRTAADRDKAISEIKAIIEKYN